MPEAAKRQIVQQNPNIPWNYWCLCRFRQKNPNITWEIVQQNQDKPWDYWCLSQNKFNDRKYNWSKKLHKFYSQKIKLEILHLIWIWKKSEIVCCSEEPREASKLPKDIISNNRDIILNKTELFNK
jgi:hypothetical protein